MPESWLSVIGLGFLLLIIINLPIFLFACYEYGTSAGKNPWLRSTQVLKPETGNAYRAAILLHGFGGTPSDVRSLAERLAGQGFRVVVPAIPDQTSTTFAYSRGRLAPAAYSEWLLDLIRDETALSGTPPSLIGFSMGGALATIVAADHDIHRLVLISPYFSLPASTQWVATPTKWLRWIVPVVPKAAKGQIFDPQGYREYETGSYLISLRAVLQLVKLTRIARGTAAGLALPILVFASEKDTVASFAVTEGLFHGLANARLVACNQSNHIVTYDFDRERVMTEIIAFLTAETSPRASA